jgi:hypothetical protein
MDLGRKKENRVYGERILNASYRAAEKSAEGTALKT